MTTQQVESGKQDHRNSSGGTLHTTRLVVGRFALSKGEGDGEGSEALPTFARFEPLTSILSACSRGEAEEISISEK
jgi:hypothetical protein